MLDLPARPAMLGQSINTRTEKHGTENVPAFDIPVEFVIEPAELCALLCSPEAAHRLFTWHSGMPFETALPALKALSMAERVEGCSVTFAWGLRPDANRVKFNDARLSRIKLEPRIRGQTHVSLLVQTLAVLDDGAMQLFESLGTECQLTIRSEGYGAQLAMPLHDGAAEAGGHQSIEGERGTPVEHGEQEPAVYVRPDEWR